MYLFKLNLFLSFICYVWSGAIQITSSNIDSILSSNELVFINFYANWCRFSQMLNPIYDQFADKVAKQYPQQGLVVIGKVDCDSQSSISTKYHVNKYPTLKFYRHGIMTKREYRGARQVDPLFEFIRQQVESSMIKLSTPNDLLTLDKKKHYVIGHFDSETSENYQIFSKVASLLREDCHFAGSTNKDEFKNERPTNDIVYYHSSQSSNESDQYYTGLINNQASFYAWSHEKCIPLVREITFENAEELTDEGLPFLILFHHVDDHQSVALFQREVAKQLMHERSGINCLHADGAKFSHPLQHLGKKSSDLPLLVIDSFKHMFLFPDINLISVDGKLLQFVKDLHSEKLHKDFHQPPKAVQKSVDSNSKNVESDKSKDLSSVNKDISGKNANKFLEVNHVSSPPESVFIHLSPSRSRYSFRDEL
ncbi:unnamed protein product [Adineta steineri]|uniref:Thioredoxin domain-containing protein n=2 Tax=Adineta steineri TaxID=433720 RepID=A0A815BR40_9BILA|nr:unnamed protein product [Adineta steineri]CAF3876289.1 unnamed protein product [Adineta steineri]